MRFPPMKVWGGGFYPMLLIERIGLLARFQMVVVHLETFAFEQIDRFQSIRTNVVRHDHSVNGGSFGRHDMLRLEFLSIRELGASILVGFWSLPLRSCSTNGVTASLPPVFLKRSPSLASAWTNRTIRR